MLKKIFRIIGIGMLPLCSGLSAHSLKNEDMCEEGRYKSIHRKRFLMRNGSKSPCKLACVILLERFLRFLDI